MMGGRNWPVVAVAVGSFAILTTAASAQKKANLPTPVPAPLLGRLNPSADQQNRLQAAAAAFEAAAQQAKAQAGTADQKQILGAAATAYREALRGALTPAQQEQLRALYEEGLQYRFLGELGWHLAAINLTEDQKAKIKAAIERYQPDLEKLGAAAKLNKDEAAARRAHDLRMKLVEEVTAVLTAEQRQSLPPLKRGKSA
jgi:Spy/CpxP family protein refolding chaperone